MIIIRRPRPSVPLSYRPSATLHRSTPFGPSRRRRLGLAAVGGGAAVAISSGLAAVVAGGAYAAPRAASALPGSSAAVHDAGAPTLQAHLRPLAHVEPAAPRRTGVGPAASRSRRRTPIPGPVGFSGLASWYGPGFEGLPTASGQPFDEDALTAASRTLPLGSRVQVCHDGSCVTVLINDRGPVSPTRVLDLSRAAAQRIGLYSAGVGEVAATVLD